MMTTQGELYMLEYLKGAIAARLMRANAFLTPETHPTHPLLVTRIVDGHEEKGFPLKLHENHPEAPLSPYFLNLRTEKNPKKGPLNTGDVQLLAEGMLALARTEELSYDDIAGVPNAGTEFARAYQSLEPRVGVIELEKEVTHERRWIGKVKTGVTPGRTCLLVDDLITGADTKVEAFRSLQKAGAVVTDVAVVVDREQGGEAELAKIGVRLHALWKISALVKYYKEFGMISLRTYEKIHTYNPRV